MAKILLAEDDESLRRFLTNALRKAGHEVVDYGQGDQALTALEAEPNEHGFDLLLTDIVMPVMDGIELARRAEDIDPTLKIVFITGFAAVALNPDNEAPRNAKVLSKPFHLRDLVQEVERVVAA
ncbi:MAG: response regulator [Pseudomonadota bacterium]